MITKYDVELMLFIIERLLQCLSPPLKSYQTFSFTAVWRCAAGKDLSVLPATMTWVHRRWLDAVMATMRVTACLSSAPAMVTCRSPIGAHVQLGVGMRWHGVWSPLITSSGGVPYVQIEFEIQIAIFRPSSSQFCGIEPAALVPMQLDHPV